MWISERNPRDKVTPPSASRLKSSYPFFFLYHKVSYFDTRQANMSLDRPNHFPCSANDDASIAHIQKESRARVLTPPLLLRGAVSFLIKQKNRFYARAVLSPFLESSHPNTSTSPFKWFSFFQNNQKNSNKVTPKVTFESAPFYLSLGLLEGWLANDAGIDFWYLC